MIAGGLGKHSFEDIQAMFEAKASWAFQLGMGPQGFAMRSSTFTSGVEDQLQILAAYMTDPGFRPALDARLPTAIDMMYRTFLTQPAVAVSTAVTRQVAPDYPGNPLAARGDGQASGRPISSACSSRS